MIIVGYIGMFVVRKNSLAVYAMLGSAPYFNVANYVFAVLPMFVLMGAIANYSGISKDLFKTAQKWFGNIPGGLAISSIAGCAGFAAVCGDSMACAVTMGSVAYPEMKRHQYNSAISTGCLAAGGTLGILIPPSIGFIIYSIISEESVGKLFIAGITPGILLAILFIICIWVLNRFRPHWFPAAERFSLKERIVSLTKIWAVVALFVLILGGMLGGFFSPNEGGAVGAFGAFLIGIFRRRLNVKDFIQSLKETAAITNRLFLIIIGVGILGYFLAATRFPNYLADFVLSLGAGKYTILMAIFFLYLILGCLMNVIPMIMLTLPAIYPTIIAVGFDPLWFGVFTVLLMEMGQISPPVGINVFSISIVTDVPMGKIFKGIFPFLLCMFICLVILTIFPELALFLVDKFSIS
jgi:tripartite ATP-independent transporter DctM subunit